MAVRRRPRPHHHCPPRVGAHPGEVLQGPPQGPRLDGQARPGSLARRGPAMTPELGMRGRRREDDGGFPEAGEGPSGGPQLAPFPARCPPAEVDSSVPTLCLRLFRSWRLPSSPGGFWRFAALAESPHNAYSSLLLASPGGSCPLLSARVERWLPKPKVAGPTPVARSTYKNDVGSSAYPVPTQCLPVPTLANPPPPADRPGGGLGPD